MTDLQEHADAYRGDGPEIVLTSDLPQRPEVEIASSTLADHDELTDEGQFPQHGSFLEVETPEGETEYWECPGGLAALVMELADEEELEPEGALLSVSQVSKTPSGEWRFVASLSDGAEDA